MNQTRLQSACDKAYIEYYKLTLPGTRISKRAFETTRFMTRENLADLDSGREIKITIPKKESDNGKRRILVVTLWEAHVLMSTDNRSRGALRAL